MCASQKLDIVRADISSDASEPDKRLPEQEAVRNENLLL